MSIPWRDCSADHLIELSNVIVTFISPGFFVAVCRAICKSVKSIQKKKNESHLDLKKHDDGSSTDYVEQISSTDIKGPLVDSRPEYVGVKNYHVRPNRATKSLNNRKSILYQGINEAKEAWSSQVDPQKYENCRLIRRKSNHCSKCYSLTYFVINPMEDMPSTQECGDCDENVNIPPVYFVQGSQFTEEQTHLLVKCLPELLARHHQHKLQKCPNVSENKIKPEEPNFKFNIKLPSDAQLINQQNLAGISTKGLFKDIQPTSIFSDKQISDQNLDSRHPSVPNELYKLDQRTDNEKFQVRFKNEDKSSPSSNEGIKDNSDKHLNTDSSLKQNDFHNNILQLQDSKSLKENNNGDLFLFPFTSEIHQSDTLKDLQMTLSGKSPSLTCMTEESKKDCFEVLADSSIESFITAASNSTTWETSIYHDKKQYFWNLPASNHIFCDKNSCQNDSEVNTPEIHVENFDKSSTTIHFVSTPGIKEYNNLEDTLQNISNPPKLERRECEDLCELSTISESDNEEREIERLLTIKEWFADTIKSWIPTFLYQNDEDNPRQYRGCDFTAEPLSCQVTYSQANNNEFAQYDIRNVLENDALSEELSSVSSKTKCSQVHSCHSSLCTFQKALESWKKQLLVMHATLDASATAMPQSSDYRCRDSCSNENCQTEEIAQAFWRTVLQFKHTHLETTECQNQHFKNFENENSFKDSNCDGCYKCPDHNYHSGRRTPCVHVLLDDVNHLLQRLESFKEGRENSKQQPCNFFHTANLEQKSQNDCKIKQVDLNYEHMSNKQSEGKSTLSTLSPSPSISLPENLCDIDYTVEEDTSFHHDQDATHNLDKSQSDCSLINQRNYPPFVNSLQETENAHLEKMCSSDITNDPKMFSKVNNELKEKNANLEEENEMNAINELSSKANQQKTLNKSKFEHSKAGKTSLQNIKTLNKGDMDINFSKGHDKHKNSCFDHNAIENVVVQIDCQNGVLSEQNNNPSKSRSLGKFAQRYLQHVSNTSLAQDKNPEETLHSSAYGSKMDSMESMKTTNKSLCSTASNELYTLQETLDSLSLFGSCLDEASNIINESLSMDVKEMATENGFSSVKSPKVIDQNKELQFSDAYVNKKDMNEKDFTKNIEECDHKGKDSVDSLIDTEMTKNLTAISPYLNPLECNQELYVSEACSQLDKVVGDMLNIMVTSE